MKCIEVGEMGCIELPLPLKRYVLGCIEPYTYMSLAVSILLEVCLDSGFSIVLVWFNQPGCVLHEYLRSGSLRDIYWVDSTRLESRNTSCFEVNRTRWRVYLVPSRGTKGFAIVDHTKTILWCSNQSKEDYCGMDVHRASGWGPPLQNVSSLNIYALVLVIIA